MPVSVSLVEEANEVSEEYQILVDADSFVSQVTAAVVVAVVVSRLVMVGAVSSDVVNDQVELLMNPSNKLSELSLKAVPATVT